MKKPFISIVIPLYNESRNIKPLYEEIKQVSRNLILDGKISGFEVIFVDDGSRDNGWEILKSLKRTEKNLRAVRFRKNFAKAEAYKAGFELCKGDLIFTMDGDLQDNPQNMPDFLEKISYGYDLVIGWKYKRKDSITKTFPSKIFNFILRSSTKLNLHDFDNGYRCMKREVLPHLEIYEGLYRYIPIFASTKGFKVGEVKVDHRKRKFGKSKYGFSRFSKGFFDLITVKFLFFYMKRPMHFFGTIGIVSFLMGFFIALYLTYIKFFLGELIGNRPLLTLSVLLIIVGLQFLFFGLIGEMIANISRKEKLYVIRETI